MFTLILFVSLASASVQQSIWCASLLDQSERAGGVVLPVVAQTFVDTVVEKLNLARGSSNERTSWQRLRDRVGDLRPGAARVIVDDVARPAPDAGEARRRRRVVAGLRDLRELILTSADPKTPIRRVSHGRRAIAEFLNGIKAQAYADEAALEREYALKIDALTAETTASRGARAAEFEELRAKIRREGAESWRAKYFGPSSDLTVAQRLAVLAGYAKNVFGVSLLSGLITPAAIPVTAVTLGAGWWAVRQWLYLGVDHGRVFVSGFLRERKLTKAVSRVEKFRAGVARADHQIADVDALLELIERTDVPRAVASFTYDVALPMDPRAPEFSEVLNGSILRTAAADAPTRGRRWVRLHHVLHFDQAGEPHLATTLIERTDLPATVRAWASTLVINLFGG